MGSSRDTFPWTHLPTKKVTLQRYRGIRNIAGTAGTRDSKTNFIQICWDELKELWDAARIPTIDEHNGIKKIKAMIKWFDKISANKRYLELRGDKVTEAENNLNELLDLAPRNVEEVMRSPKNKEWEQDFSFYLNQKCYPQTQIMEGKDHKTEGIERRRAKRISEQTDRKMKEQGRKKRNHLSSPKEKDKSTSYNFWWWDIESESRNQEDEETQESDQSDWEELQSPPRKMKKPDTVTVEMNLKSIFENTTEAATRVRVSAAAHLELLRSFVNRCTSTSTESLTASLSTCKRQRERKIKNIAKKNKDK